MKFLVFLLVFVFSVSSFAVKIRATFVRPLPFGVEVLQGNVPGHSVTAIVGHNNAVSTSLETVWQEGGLYPWPTSASLMTVSSLDVDDTSAGAGLRTVRITGLNAGVVTTEIITLNGQSAVTTVNQYDRINLLVGLTAGATEQNEGIVYIGTGTVTAGKPAVVLNLIDIGKNLSDSAIFTIPNGVNGYIQQFLSTAEGGKVISSEAFIRFLGGLFLQTLQFNMFDSPLVSAPYMASTKLPPRTDVDIRSRIGSGSGDLKVFFTLLLVDI